MKLTITISNWNRDWFLDRSIYLLSKQTLNQNDWELVIVDDGSTDKTDEVISRYKNQNIIKNFHYIKKINKRKEYGNCAIARNIGAKFGSGNYILFTDPEVMPLPDWAERHYLAHKENIVIIPGTGFYTSEVSNSGVTLSPDLQEQTDRNVVGYCMQPREYHIVTEKCRGPFLGNAYTDYNWFDIVGTWRTMEEKMNKVKITCGITDQDIIREFFIYQATQAGHSISRKLFFQLRGFEENFANKSLGLDKWAGEDTWFHECLRRVKSKTVLEKARAIHIYHDKVCSNYDAVTYAHQYEKEHPDQWQSNLNRDFGLIEENGFEVVF